MNVSQALEYERQPFIPMFIYGDHGAMESERQKGEEALKVLETEYFTAEGDPSFDFATVRDLADRNRDLCDQIGEARLRNVTPATLSRGLSDADTCAAIGKMQKRTAASVMREIRGDRDALGVAYARKPIQGTVLGIDIETTGRAPERGYIINVGWEIMELTSDAVPHDAEAHYCGLPDIYRRRGCAVVEYPPHHLGQHRRKGAVPREQGAAEAAAQAHEEVPVHGTQRRV